MKAIGEGDQVACTRGVEDRSCEAEGDGRVQSCGTEAVRFSGTCRGGNTTWQPCGPSGPVSDETDDAKNGR